MDTWGTYMIIRIIAKGFIFIPPKSVCLSGAFNA